MFIRRIRLQLCCFNTEHSKFEESFAYKSVLQKVEPLVKKVLDFKEGFVLC